MGKAQKEKYPKIKKMLNNYYDSVEKKSKKKRIIRYLHVLFFPYLSISAIYIIFRWNDVKKSNILFWICVIIASTWFIIGPALVQRFKRELKTFQTDDLLPQKVKEYFIEQNDRYLTLFIHYRIIESIIFNFIAIVPILLYPEILSKNLTNGFMDLFFWVIIVFLIGFLCYCTNATAYISLIAFHILSDLKKDRIISYMPTTENHRYTINKIRKICGKAVRYLCSALVFIPLAVYFINQQPELVINEGMPQILTSSSQHPIYLIWVVLMLIFYSFFLLFFTTYQYETIKGYTKKKSSDFILNAQIKFISLKDNNQSSVPSKGLLPAAAYQYTEYLKLQEIRLLCKPVHIFDINDIVPYFSILVSMFSAIQGIREIINWTP